jgi:hypothetical protein
MRRTANHSVRMQHVRNGSTSEQTIAAKLIGRLAEQTHRAGERFVAWPLVTVEHFDEVGYDAETGPDFEETDPDLAQFMRVHVVVSTVYR